MGTCDAALTQIAMIGVLSAVFSAATANAYTNYTVGDAKGWFFYPDTNSSSADYPAWASKLTFSLGDFLIFNTTTNQTVVQTYNKTAYDACDYDDSDPATYSYSSGNTQFDMAEVIPVPLIQTGPNFFFSDAGEDGVQCSNGMKFGITVAKGQGLPPSLNQPPPFPSSDSSGGSQSPPIASTGQGERFANGGSMSPAPFLPLLQLLLLAFGGWVLSIVV
ncbi:hypothetical protein AMTRI_Chr09g16310 [Amborella trichopoda]|uniref:Phytocyanin domain-containing protein n=1 Tax=Amborella trichopoda TaxID=13333 RepID=W1NLY0_AMBTC|nr:cucumber peeling cupredoxin [Amborella trichopoda]ERM96548.1 hypothetical protein AMTR_s00001p00268670 [Amborella trichopoda]|eukprot:XP_006829132.1 cucumber peeling cupredoxin [Amborella trichopoda]